MNLVTNAINLSFLSAYHSSNRRIISDNQTDVTQKNKSTNSSADILVKAKDADEIYDIFVPKTIPNLPCACCGMPMLTRDEKAHLAEKISSTSGENLRNALTSAMPFLKQDVKAYANLIIEGSKKHPELNIQQLTQIKIFEIGSNLWDSQYSSLNKIKEMGKSLTGELGVKTQDAIDNALKYMENGKIMPDENTIENMIKRKMDKSAPVSKNRRILGKMINYVKENKFDSSNMLVLNKYADRNTDKIAHIMLDKSTITKEHIKTKHAGGSNAISNLISECKGCNGARGHKPLPEWLKIHPEMRKNLQNNINAIIGLIDDGVIKNYDDYPAQVRETFLKESNGALDLII